MTGNPDCDTVVLAWARLIKAHTVVLRAVEASLKAAGFPPLAWYDVLLELRRAESGCLRPVDFEGRLLLAQHNVSRLIDRLERARLVMRRPHPEDGRGQEVALTQEGRDLQKRMWPAYRDAVLRHVGEKLADAQEAATLAHLLGKLLARDED